MPRVLLLCAVVLAMDAAEVTDAVVGGLDLNRLEIVISDGPTFPAEEVAAKLREDPKLIPATHFFASRPELLRLITERCVTGYHACGFPAPQVSTRVVGRGASERLVVQVSEGPRRRWGTVRISDPGPVDAELLRQRLCAPWRAPDAEADDKPDEPIIVSGEPARFDAFWNNNLIRTICDFYALEGFQDCKPVVRIGEAKDGLVDCLISFAAPPRALVVNSLSVTGVIRNQPDAVIAWLDRTSGLRVGGTATRAAMNKARQALTASGRFMASTLTSTPTPDHPERVDVVLHAIDGESLPLLDQELTPVQQAALRWREQLLRDLENGTASVTIAVTDPTKTRHLAVCFNVLNGCFLRANIRDPISPIDAIGGFSSQHLFYRSLRLARSSTIACEVRLKVTFGLDTSTDPNSPHTANFQIGATTDEDEALADITATTSYVLSQIFNAVRDGDRLISHNKTSTITIDLSGATLFEVRSTDETGQTWLMQATRTPWADLVQQTAGVPATEFATPTPDGGRGLLQLVGDDLLPVVARFSGVDEAALRLWLSLGIHLASTWWSEPATEDQPKKDSYYIPIDMAPEQMMAHLALMMRQLIQEYTKDIWPSSSWPMLMVNEASAVMSGRTEHTRAVLSHLVDGSGMGPVGHGALAVLMQMLDPRLSRTIAKLGMDHLNTDAWARDLLTLVPRLSLIRTVLASITDPPTAARVFPDAQRTGFIDLVERAQREQTPAEERELLNQLARFLWQAGGEEMTRAWLTQLATEPAPTGEAPP